jgi:predicted flap endonuclease-1-like 5' DNA nuclease
MMQTIIQHPVLSSILLLVGGIIGWWLRVLLRENALREEFLLRDQERIHLAATNAQLKKSHDLKEADLKRIGLELQYLQENANNFEQERQFHQQAVQSAAAKMQHLQLDLQAQTSKILTYDEQVLGLRTRNAQLTGEVNALRDSVNSSEVDLKGLLNTLQQNNLSLEEAIAQIEQERNTAQHELEAAYLEIENLEGEIIEKNKSITSSNGTSKLNGNHAIAMESQMSLDDLKIINGIGPFTEKKLHAMGIYSFAQLADMSEATMENLNESLELYKGKIKKEGWVEQAKHLLEMA